CAATAVVIKGETIKKYVRTYIEKNISWPKNVVRVEFPSTVSDLRLTGEKITCRVLSKRNEDFIGNSSFTFKCYENGTFLHGKTVRVKIEIGMDVVVSAKFLRRNVKIEHDDVRLVKKWFNRLPSNIISSPDAVIGMKLRTNVKPNAEITGNMVRAIPMVKRGKPVRIIFENGPMRITTIGLSDQDGLHGELIKVRNVSSKNMIYARVTGNSLVKVEF
ncbi:MAG: flagellar basal body P-ring formation chaperone FlgA, partial [Desulfobacterales bacterium]|nr:flagellar basal body P-ring formation chaperone FlgA [Desulfobacterales bacterium]